VNTSTAWLAAELHARAHAFRHGSTPRLRGDRGEGVISAAIAVLIMAFLGAAMYIGFREIFKNAECNVEKQVEAIGGNAAAPPAANPNCA
jgi:hypothetical protein